ncbi:MlaD family protein [Komagataeibacter intermedius]|uniref:Paraquat-inducible protein B n=3 Tax=Komagataeibacter intermedius TaxID=66229 RepID=A0A0N1N483_9PROT|nr:MlaD family protein [Komagataeibacter intermedius]KPH85148.1 paraquat-inducible protein B [Komagataeibacter intermedius AF2]GAN85708.1 paraquat-inducible protein B [Komagataeibacter intermedius TF2]GBQ78321.1 paraquat-inducible protein B [Komagataeibacter intermedius NRIC 0521]
MPMAGRQTLIGSAVLGVAAAALIILGVKGALPLPGRTSEAMVIFESPTNGLDIGSPVNFRGVPVGAVERITVKVDPADHHTYMPVYILFDPSHAPGRSDLPPLPELIANGLRAEMTLHSLVTGQTELDLDLDPKTPARLHPGLVDTTLTEIPMGQTALQQLETTLVSTSVQQLHHDLQTAMASIRRLAADMNRDLPGMITSIRETSAHSDAAVTHIRTVITDVENRASITINKLDRLIATNSQQFAARRAELLTLIATTHQTMTQAHETLASLRTLTDPQSRDRLNLDDTMRDIMEAGYGLRGFANEVESNPQLLLMGRNK